ncbi:MlaA family lipoprotein [Acinetobacter stercoris]|uniref:Putative phospholipid-binding lipoprotein MlaA n=1 Tax=Acinetobacter stercoris TaxID=2126983 RepID=A0A2U3N167_9GAMM|nr:MULTISPECIES: VacJ family lipoprotein [Acinetobacter]SPL71384.1 putative phospholipid-binding lipoprotein MlaA precursor [Acinetobacter stercoris]
MRHLNFLCVSLLSISFSAPVFAQQDDVESNTQDANVSDIETANTDSSVEAKKPSHFQSLKELKELKNVRAKDFKVNANAAQSDDVKDPLQPLNREIYAFNDMLDRNIVRPIAVQYKEKVPDDVRSSYSLFRKNLIEPWNAVNQLVQGRPLRALKSLGRFTVNTVTSLGLADPARRLGMPTEEESLGTTLGYWGVPSGPYLMLPILGPSTLRNSLDTVAEGYANPLNHVMDNNDQQGLMWSNTVVGGINTRSRLLDVEDVLQGDKYAAIRDIYLQRLNYNIAQKKGQDAAEASFIDDETDDQDDSDTENSQ